MISLATRAKELEDAVQRLATAAEIQALPSAISTTVASTIQQTRQLLAQITALEGTDKELELVTGLVIAIAIALIVVVGLLLLVKGTPVTPPQPPIPPQPPQPPTGGLPNGIHFTVVNQSKNVTAADVKAYLLAQQTQIDSDFSPAWGGSAVIDTQPGGWLVYLQDVSDSPGALGYHDVDSTGTPYAKVFVQTSLDGGVSWESVASHEVLETLADSNANTTVKGPDGCNWYREVGDPCEDVSYQRNGVELSDFVFPSWFSRGGVAPFDFLKALKAPFTVTPGGYAASDCGQITGSRKNPTSVDRDYA